MKRLIYAVMLSFLFIMITNACDITNLTVQEKQNKGQAADEENKESTVFQIQNKSSGGDASVKTFKDLVKTNPDAEYEVTNGEGYYSIGPINGHIINIKWGTPNGVDFRINNGEMDTISNCVVEEENVKAKALIEAPLKGIYINDSLKDGKGLVFISWMKEKNFYLYKNNELKEHKDIQYYFLSPLQKYIILFPGNYKTKPVLVDLASGKETDLPMEADHGWPQYAAGMSFSADETKLMYEDWSKMELCIYDIKGQRSLYHIGENGYSLLEGTFSPDGRMAAYLKYDNSKEIKELYDERNPIGQKLVIYDLEKKKVVKEIQGEEFVYQKPIWSPDSKYLIFNMIQVKDNTESEEQMYCNPYLLNISTGKVKKLADNTGEIKYALAWSEDNKKVMLGSKSKGILNKFSAVDIKLGDELSIDSDKYYISRVIKTGTMVYEIIGIDNSKLEQFDTKNNAALSLDQKYIAFSAAIDGNEYLIIAPVQEVK